MELPSELETQIDRWRGYVQRRQAISADDVDELEDHLRRQISERKATGLDDDEAFLVAIKRLGNMDAISREYAHEHSERLWKQLALVPEASATSGLMWREPAIIVALAAGAGLAVKAGMTWLPGDGTLARNFGLLVFPFLAAYFAWKRRFGARATAAIAVPFVILAILVNAYPFTAAGSTELLVVLHAPVALWLLAGIAYAGGRWRSGSRRMDFVRFTGELAIYFTLLGLGGGVLIALTSAVLQLVGVDLGPAIGSWILPFAVPGAFIVAAWLVEAKQNVVENIAPVLTRIFTPLTIVMLLTVLAVLLSAGGFGKVDRELLILMDAILILVQALLLYSISARDSLTPPGLFDVVQLILVIAALVVDAVMLTAMLTRIAEFGFSSNKIAALGLNLVLLVHLAGAGWLAAGFVRRRRRFIVIEQWQTRYLPVYGVWAAVVVVVFPPVFGFA